MLETLRDATLMSPFIFFLREKSSKLHLFKFMPTQKPEGVCSKEKMEFLLVLIVKRLPSILLSSSENLAEVNFLTIVSLITAE